MKSHKNDTTAVKEVFAKLFSKPKALRNDKVMKSHQNDITTVKEVFAKLFSKSGRSGRINPNFFA